MKFTLASGELLKKLNFLSGVIGTSNTLPILDNFLFDFDGNDLNITASDLETTMTAKISGVVAEKRAICIPAKLLVDILKTFTEQPLEFTVKGNSVIEINTISGFYEIAYYPGADFPKLEAIKNTSKTTIPSKVLVSAINKTLFATGNDDLRPVMTGVLFQLSPNGVTFVSTDAHRLVKYARADVKVLESSDFIVPKKPLTVLKGVLASVTSDAAIQYHESNAEFTFDDYTINCRLIDGKYPNYEAVIPKDNPSRLIIDRVQLLASVKRVSTFSDKQTHQVRFKVAGQELNISTEDKNYSNKADERLTCNFEGNDIEIGFNSRFLADALSNLQSKNVQIELSSSQRAGILTPFDGEDEGEKNLILVMPVRLAD